MQEREVILHCHLFKNAGTTLDWALQRSFGNGFFDHRDDHEMRQGGIEYLDGFLSSNPTVRSLSSHHMPFMPEREKPFYWLLLLREPISRVRSVYDFEVKQPVASLGSKMAKKMDLSEYIQWRMQDDVQPVIKNFHVRYLCNKAIPEVAISDSDMECAIQRLTLNNVLVGTLERFDESMVIFEELLRETFPEIDLSYVRKNTGTYNADSSVLFINEMTSKSRELLFENNLWDMRLHKMVSVDQKKIVGDIQSFDDKLESFRARCSSLVLSENG